MASSDENDGPTRIRSVKRAAQLLLLVASCQEHERTVKNLASKLGTSLGTTYHLLATLVDEKLLTRDERRRYHLGYAINNLASAYNQQTMPPTELIDPLRTIVGRTGESAYLSAWRYGELEVLVHAAGTRAVRVVDLKPGFHGFAHARASGKVLLSFGPPDERDHYLESHPLTPVTDNTIIDVGQLLEELQMVRKLGFATDEEEFSDGVGCVSVPILDHSFLLGAYTLSAPIERYQRHRNEYLACLLDAAAQAVAPVLGGASEELS